MKYYEYLKLCLVTDLASRSFAEYQKIILAAIRGGITSIQLREKNLSYQELKAFACFLQALLKPYHIPLIINDHVQLAHEINADGVHIGQTDMSAIEARKILGNNKIIGLSIETIEDLEIANQLNCIDYVAASAVFPSKTKTNCKTIWSLDGLKIVTEKSLHPVVAIGGIDTQNVNAVIENGAAGIAVISAIHDDPRSENIAAILISKINKLLLQRKNYV